MNFSPHSRSKTRKSFVALLLQPMLHNFSALAPVNHLDGITYQPNCRETRESNAALLLPHLFPVSPLLHYSYKKIGGWGCRAFCVPMVCIGMGGLMVNLAPSVSTFHPGLCPAESAAEPACPSALLVLACRSANLGR